MSRHSQERIARSYEVVDDMPPDLRGCVHAYGYAIVNSCRNMGVTKPERIHQLVTDIWKGARQPMQRPVKLGTLDWLLVQHGCGLTAAQLARALKADGYAIVPTTPTAAMMEASLTEVSGHNVLCTKKEKHIRRFRAAINAAPEY